MAGIRSYDHELVGGPLRVVFLPGIMGSVLAQSGSIPVLEPRAIWGTLTMLRWLKQPGLGPAVWQARLLAGNGINRHGAVATDVPPSLTRDGLLELPPVSVPYREFVERLRREASADVLVFPYDWRLSNDVSALELENAIRTRWFPGAAADVPAGARVSIVAHSMGGLVARNFIEGRNGYRVVRRLITVGTPHQGAVSAYTHFLGLTSALPQFVVPLAMQLAQLQFCGSARQLLPNYDFVVLRGGALEPITSTYAGMPAHATGISTTDVIRLMRDGFQPRAPWASLNAFLSAHDVEYHCLGSTGLSTPRAYDSFTNFIHTSLEGDETVPLMSALCPDAVVSLKSGVCSPASHIRHHRFQRVVHQDLFRDRGVQDRCLSLLGVTQAATWTAEAAVAEIEAEIETELSLSVS